MSDEYNRAFHRARARAEQLAADRANCELTRALHAQLADLHVERILAIELVEQSTVQAETRFIVLETLRPALISA